MSRDGFPQPGTRIPPFLDAAGLFSELQDDEVGRGHGDNARNGLEIHGFPAIGQRNPLEREDYTAWPSLPGACEFREKSCSWAAESCPWQGNFGRSTSRFSLGDSQWPSLAPRQQERFSGVLERNSLATRIADEREDILGTKGPTQQSQQLGGEDERNGGDGFSLAGRRLGIESGGSSGKGWMRLPPILMPSSHQQQQQKRCRQAAFDNSSNPSSPEEPNGFASRDAGKGALSAPPPPPSGYLPPVYLMLNKDFVVISPLKENLLLTLALAEHRRPSTPPSFDEASSAADLFETSPEVTEVAQVAAAAAATAAAAAAATATTAVGDAKRRQVFVGRFEAFSSFVKFGLGRDAMRVATESNAGGTSTISESLSVEYFVRKFKATDVVTEMEVEYCAMNWKKVDYICNLYGQRVGVSVTRAMSYPNPEDFSPQMAYRLLYKKLFGLVVARHGVTDRHSFSQCVLHVWCETTTTAKLLQAQYKEVSEELDITDDVIMVLTVAEGWHARPIFSEMIFLSLSYRFGSLENTVELFTELERSTHCKNLHRHL